MRRCCSKCLAAIKAKPNASFAELRTAVGAPLDTSVVPSSGESKVATASEPSPPARAREQKLEAALKEKEAALAEKSAELSKLREASTAQPRIKLRDEITKELGKISAMSPDIVKARKYLRRLEGAYAKRIETYASTNPARVARIEMEAAECRRQGDAILKSMQAPAPDAK